MSSQNAVHVHPISPKNGSASFARLQLRDRIATVRADIANAEKKRSNLDAAITSRRAALNRLEAQLVLIGESGSARSCDE